MRLVYFAWVREAIGVDGEEFELPADVQTIAETLNWLAGLSERHARAFADRGPLRFALDQQMAGEEAIIAGLRELAIFPPVTGG